MPGYVENVTQEKLSENPRYNNTNSIYLLAPIDNELGSQQQLDETLVARSLTETRYIGAQPAENNRVVGSITKADVVSDN